MRFPSLVLIASMVGALAFSAQSPAVPSPPPEARDLPDVFATDAKVDHFALSADARRTYFVSKTGEAWLYDSARKTTVRIASGPLWDLNLSPVGNALAYTKGGAGRGDQFVWMLALDPSTGLPRGAERRLSPLPGGAPSIAPDGKLVAYARDDPSGVGQSVVVSPAAGGTERIVVPMIPSSIANIRWTPDGGTLYVGVNPPVACVPDWSCLPLKPDLRQPLGRICRVAVSGGGVTDVVSAANPSPGLSPDGTTLMYLGQFGTGTTRRWVIANADGTPRDTLALPRTQTPTGWLSGSTVLVASGGSLKRMRVMSLADAQSRILVDNAEFLFEPSWSPDGMLLMTVARSGPHAELRIQHADGSAPQTVVLPETSARLTAWSPDQKWVAYVGSNGDQPAHVAAVDLTTGRSQDLYAITGNQSVVLRWRADSRGLALMEVFGRPDTERRVVFRTVDLSGTTTPLRELMLAPMRSAAFVADDRTGIVMQDQSAGYRAVSLSGQGQDRDIPPVPPSDASLATLSADGKWLTWRRPPAPTEGTAGEVLELVRVDGSAHRAIPVPFRAGANPRIVPGTDDLLVLEEMRPDSDSGAFLVSPGATTPRRLFTYSSQNIPPDVAVSPDGRMLLYLNWDTVPPSVRAMNLSAARAK